MGWKSDAGLGYANVMSKVSGWIAIPLVSIVTYNYAHAIIRRPAGEATSLAVTAFGLMTAMAAVCFSVSSPVGRGERTAQVFKYAGEKFLLASVLLLQILFMMYARDGLVEVASKYPRTRGVVTTSSGIIMGVLSTAAAYTFYWAIEALNDELFKIWKWRLGWVEPARKEESFPALGGGPVPASPQPLQQPASPPAEHK